MVSVVHLLLITGLILKAAPNTLNGKDPVCPRISGLMFGALGVLGIWGEWPFIFRELGSTGYYFRGARKQAHNFGV